MSTDQQASYVPTHVLEINDVRQLEGLRLVWASLLAETRDASFFQTLDWLLVFWKHFAANHRLRVLVVYVHGKPIGILPLVVRHQKRGPLAMRVLTYPLADWGTFYGPIGPNPAATLQLGLAHIRNSRRDWDYIDLRWMAIDTVDQGRTEAALNSVGLSAESGQSDDVALLDLAATWDDYVANRGHKWRVNLRRSERKLAEQGEVTFVRHRPASAAEGSGDPRWDLYEVCEQVAAESWQGSSSDGTTLSHAEIRAYLRDVHEAASRIGAVDLCLLYVNARPVAFIYNYQFAGEVFGLRRGHLQSTDAGAGSVLLARTVEDSYARGDRVFNLGAGYLDAKRQWLTRIVRSASLSVYPSLNMKAQAVRFARGFRRKGEAVGMGVATRIKS